MRVSVLGGEGGRAGSDFLVLGVEKNTWVSL